MLRRGGLQVEGFSLVAVQQAHYGMPMLFGILILAAAALASDTTTVSAVVVDTDHLDRDLRALTGESDVGGEPILSRHISHPGNLRAVEYLVDAMASVDGLSVQTELFSTNGLALFNVLGRIEGTDEQAPAVLITAHLDSTASFTEGWDPSTDPAPGADDDASGVAAVLECARQLSAMGPFARDIEFIAFNAEEEGLKGSKWHVDHRTTDVEVVFNLDPVGFNPGDVLFFAYDDRSADEAEAFMALADGLDSPVQLLGVNEASIGGDKRSDHWPFWKQQIKALHIGTFPQPPSYHTQDDVYDVVDVDFLAQVTSLTCARVAQAAGPGELAQCGCANTRSAATLLGLLGGLVVAWSRRSGVQTRPRR